MRTSRSLSALALLLIVASPALAAGPPQLKPFSAEYVYLEDGEPMTGMSGMRVAVGRNGFRVDYPMHVSLVELGPAGAQIAHLDPGSKTYTVREVSYDSEEFETESWMFLDGKQLAEGCESEGGECELLGTTRVAGRVAERWRLVDEEGEGESVLDPELGIVLRASSGDGSGLEIRDLSIGEPPASVLGIPAGYREAGSEGG